MVESQEFESATSSLFSLLSLICGMTEWSKNHEEREKQGQQSNSPTPHIYNPCRSQIHPQVDYKSNPPLNPTHVFHSQRSEKRRGWRWSPVASHIGGQIPQPNRPLGLEFEPHSLQFLHNRFGTVRKSSKPGTGLDRFYLKPKMSRFSSIFWFGPIFVTALITP